MNRSKALFLLLAVAGVIGFILSAVMFVSAICFGELGRIVLYFVTATVCAELTVLSVRKVLPNRNDKE